MILIIDNQSAYLKKFKLSYLVEKDIDFIIFDHNQPINLSSKTVISGIILSGGKGNPFEPLNLTTNFIALMNFDVPIIGFCLGHEIIASAYGGRVKKLSEHHLKKEPIKIVKADDPIFEGIEEESILLQKRHNFYVSELPPDFEVLGTSDTCAFEIIRHGTKPIYGFQSHPEVSGPIGITIIENFLKLCEKQ
ncbi:MULTISPECIES: gamma-glutamyl-gamma-aminobutyrate hydrolase family protein [unclassified Fusibacter]|uniref:glutamine amidotransferase-related protein n=1 Tax=unclassified Fusibacter TaxID=2624464 RepID=UPI00101232F7|nr:MULTISPECIES: gamma-glutamyl-gamma-aminobutyrate hydrolase family protein [unclassified Fusibacter]MCK8060038.1 gamma-glutamyl-gamma-aminobutyrate hydrolase family protein [Fusibacter sp. A2]NPE22178.1 C26 family cysteine hydrolase domain-containing family [Fusibacter sp. A1]RXV60954.1 hypothetical protein DWB64_10055 [Fusibacter sp. A1]